MHDVTSFHFLFGSPKIISGMQYGVYIPSSWNIKPELSTAPDQQMDKEVGTFHVNHIFLPYNIGEISYQHGSFQHMNIS